MRNTLVRACSTTPATIKGGDAPALPVDVSKDVMQPPINGLSIAGGRRGTLKGEYYKKVDMVFQFLAEFINWYIEMLKESPLTKVHMLFFKLMLKMKSDNGRKAWSEWNLMKLKHGKEQFKRSLEMTFSDHCNFGLYTLKFHLLHHVIKYLQLLGTMSILDALTFEHYNVNIQHAYGQTSKRRNTCLNATARIIGRRMIWTQTDLMMLFFQWERDAEKCQVHRLLKDGANLVHNGEKCPCTIFRMFWYTMKY